jgi:hypothetical protein
VELDQLICQQLKGPVGSSFWSIATSKRDEIGLLFTIQFGERAWAGQFVQGVSKPFLALSLPDPLDRCSSYFQRLGNLVLRFALMGKQQDVSSGNGSRWVLSHFEQIMQVLSIFLAQVDFVDQNHRVFSFFLSIPQGEAWHHIQCGELLSE